MSAWIDFRKEKPKDLTMAVIFNEKGSLSMVIGIYYENYDVWHLYNLNSRENYPIEVTHYFPIPKEPERI